MDKFNAAAGGYDQDFTNSPIGKLQRKAVWDYLEIILPKRPINILEINAGTGEDAIWFANKNHRVLCTDSSSEMLKVAQTKAHEKQLEKQIKFEVLDFTQPEKFQPEHQYDLIFSNFGGLNCLNRKQLQELIKISSNWLVPDGEFIAVFLSKYTIWETLYFAAKGKMKKAKRRWTENAVMANVDGEKIPTWYYSRSEIYNLTQKEYLTKGQKAIGMFVPPSYLNPMFKYQQTLLNGLNWLDEELGNRELFANLSDHFLVHLKKK